MRTTTISGGRLSPKGKKLVAFCGLAILAYLNFDSIDGGSLSELLSNDASSSSSGLRGGSDQSPRFDVTAGRRALSTTEVKEVDKFAGWVNEKASSFDEDQRHRFLAILKTKWPECVVLSWSALQCKNHIDQQIQSSFYFSGEDKNLKTEIMNLRSEYDDTYNTVVIRTNGTTGLTSGTASSNYDGMVSYDFSWDSSGQEATESQQKRIPYVNLGEETGGKLKVLQGATVDEFRGGVGARRLAWAENGGRKLNGHVYNTSAIIAGGIYDMAYQDDPVDKLRLDDKLSEAPVVNSDPNARNIGPWDCSGLTGVSCCAMIKHDVRDSDKQGSAIQCWVEEDDPDEEPLVTQLTCEHDLTKICIYSKKFSHTAAAMVIDDPILAYHEDISTAVAGGADITLAEH